MASATDNIVDGFHGEQPAGDNLSKRMRKDLEENTIPKYMNFMQERLTSDTVERAREIASENGAKRDIGEKPFFVSDEDLSINGSTGNSFALVKPGKKGRPLRVIISHSDVPSLRIPVNPIYVENSHERELSCPSVSLLTEPAGGVRPDDWYGMEVDIVGKIYLNGKERRIEIPGRIKAKSLHVDDSRYIKTFEGLKVDTGAREVKALHEMFGITSADDFAKAKLYCLPHIPGKRETRMIGNIPVGFNGRLVGNELGGFGHDDRSCVWASLQAGVETLEKNDNTVILAALDNEEIGSVGNSANYRGFFENVLIETLKVVYGKDAREIILPADLNRKLLGDLPAIFADVGVGIGIEELDDPVNVNYRGAIRLGWGVAINCGITTSPKHVSKLMDILDKDLPGKDRYFRYQIGGDYSPVDNRYSWVGSPQMFDSFFDVMPCLNVGIPVVGLHHPRTEAINVFDLHWMKEAYKAYLKA